MSTPDIVRNERGQVVEMRRPNWALEAETRLTNPEPVVDRYVPEFSDIRIINPSLKRKAFSNSKVAKVSIGNDDWEEGR